MKQRLQENAEVVGTDETFFEDDETQVILDLYNEKSGILDGEEDTEVDLTSEAFQIWKKATDENQALRKKIEEMPNVVYSTRAHTPYITQPEGVLMYMKTTEGNDSLIYIDRAGIWYSFPYHFSSSKRERCVSSCCPTIAKPCLGENER